MKKLLYLAVFCLAAFVVVLFNSCSPEAPKTNLVTDIDSLSYAYGVGISQGIGEYFERQGYEGAASDAFFKSFIESSKVESEDKISKARDDGKMIGRNVMEMFNNINTDLFGQESEATETLNKSQFIAGFIAAARDENLAIEREMAQMYLQTKNDEIRRKVNEPSKVINVAFMLDNKAKEGVVALESGLQYKVEAEGKGPKPTSTDRVKVKYVGKTVEGDVFDSNEEAVFSLMPGSAIPGWLEGIQLMSVGSKYTLFIPYELGYGEGGNPPRIKPYATLIFDVELLEIMK